MKGMNKLGLACCLALLLLIAPVLAQKQQPITDDRIYDLVLMKLAGDPDVRGGGIQVEVHQGAVTLKGKVEKEKQKSRAERLAKKVKGVTSVNNQLVVTPR